VSTVRGLLALALLLSTVSSAVAQRRERTGISAQVMPAWAGNSAPRTQVVHTSVPALDSTAIHPTHWLTGAIIGGVIFGLVGQGLCYLGDEPASLGCRAAVFTLVGVGIGVPLGALIGGQFPKSR